MAHLIGETLKLLRGVVCYEILAHLFRLAIVVATSGTEIANELLRKISQIYLHGLDLTGTTKGLTLLHEGEGQVFAMLVDLVHGINWDDDNLGKFKRTLTFASLDVFEINGDRRGLLLWAWISRQTGDKNFEKVILRKLYQTDIRWFWENIQGVYRFSVGLIELLDIIGDDGKKDGIDKVGNSLNLFFFPDYSESNSYQSLLYETLVLSGGTVNGIDSVPDLVNLQPSLGRRNIFHIHWLNAIFRGVAEEEYAERADYFVTLVSDLKKRGFEIFWTVHNYLEHETVNSAYEIEFRQTLYQLSDRVYLHHPLAIVELDWLPNKEKVGITEHGAYPQVSEELPNRDRLRSRIGLKQGDLLLVYIGMIRDYKGLDESLPVLANLLKSEPRLHLLLAGRIESDKIKVLLSDLPAGQVWIEDRYVSTVEVESIMHAADIGFLSYRSILTSGSLFHWFSCGVPVIAPALGTIPAYVVSGWNGFTYRDGEELSRRVKQCLSATSSSLIAAGDNAKRTALSLHWGLS
jgi:glycosyltransferase involved in cell wall biosynthesis